MNIYLKRNQEIVCSVKVKMCAYLKGRVRVSWQRDTHTPSTHTLFSLLEMLFENSMECGAGSLYSFQVCVSNQFTMNCSLCGSNSELTGFSTLSQSRKFLQELLP